MTTPRDTRWHIYVIAMLSFVLTSRLSAQTRDLFRDSLRLRYMRIETRATNACKVIVRTSGSMNIQTEISPANVRRWIDTATAYAAAKPQRAKGQRIRYAWIPITLGIERIVTDRLDAFEFVNSGHGIPILAREIPRIAKLLNFAANETLARSGPNGTCPTTPDQ